MTGEDLAVELGLAHDCLSGLQRRRLIQAGADRGIAAAMLGTLKAEITGRFWQPLEGAPEAIILPIFSDDLVSPESADPVEASRFGELFDVIAFRIDDPSRWALRIGAAAWLGHYGPQLFDPPPIEVHRTPWDWVCAGGRGIVPLTDKQCDLSLLFAQCRTLSVADVAQGRAIKRALERPSPTPRILVRQHQVKEAAA